MPQFSDSGAALAFVDYVKEEIMIYDMESDTFTSRIELEDEVGDPIDFAWTDRGLEVAFSGTELNQMIVDVYSEDGQLTGKHVVEGQSLGHPGMGGSR